MNLRKLFLLNGICGIALFPAAFLPDNIRFVPLHSSGSELLYHALQFRSAIDQNDL